MPAFLLALLALAPALAPAQGFAYTQALVLPKFDSVYNGTPVAPGGQGWRSTAQLWFSGSGGCTGVFIERDVILTAAHCLELAQEDDLFVTLYYQNGDPMQMRWEKSDYSFYRHPEYFRNDNTGRDTNDLAVVVLRGQSLPEEFTPAEFLTSMGHTNIGQIAYVVGGGITQAGTTAERLYFTKGTIQNYLEEDVMQIQAVAGQGICQGDSGSPLFVPVGEKLLLSSIVVSIYSNINAKCGNTVFATVINQARYDWIIQAASDGRYAL